MSVRLFMGYFLALAACSTLAFASSAPDQSAPPAFFDGGFPPPPFGYPPHHAPLHHHKTMPRHVQMAQAELTD